MPRMSDAGLMEGQLVERQRGDGIDAAGQGKLGGCREKQEGSAAGPGVDLARGDIGQTGRNSIDFQARNDGRGRVGLFGRRDELDPHRASATEELTGALERT